jgi:hypothetical protein
LCMMCPTYIVLCFVCLHLVSCVWWCPAYIVLCFFVLFVFVLSLVYGGVQHILCCVFLFWTKPKNTIQYMLDTTIHKTQDEDKQNKKTQHNICWTPPCTRWRQTKQKSVFFVLFVFILCLVYGGVQHILCCVFWFCLSSSCVLCMVVSSIYCVVFFGFVCLHLVSCVWWCPAYIVLCFFVLFVFILCLVYRCVQHILCWTPPYTRHKMKTNKTKNTIQYMLDTTIHKTQDEDKQNKKTQHNIKAFC